MSVQDRLGPIRKAFNLRPRIMSYMSENYIGKSYQYFSDIPDEVIEDEELAIVDEGSDKGYKVITAEQWEGEAESNE